MDKHIYKTLKTDMVLTVMPAIQALVFDTAKGLVLERDSELTDQDPFAVDEMAEAVLVEIVEFICRATFDKEFGLLHPCQLNERYYRAYWEVE